MKFHPVIRTIAGQTVSFSALLLLLLGGWMLLPPGAIAARGAPAKEEEKENVAKPLPPVRERFRPTAQASQATSTEQVPAAVTDRPASASVFIPPKDLPLSYLQRFENMTAFHAFIESLPDPVAEGERTMSRIHILGLPDSSADLNALIDSYQMKTLLMNPQRFSYLITDDMQLLVKASEIKKYIARVGRYVRQQDKNHAYKTLQTEVIKRSQKHPPIERAFKGSSEFENMELVLASQALRKFFFKLETDTASQVSDLTGNEVKIEDIARIDCTFKNVNGAMVLVPWKAHLGDKKVIEIWE